MNTPSKVAQLWKEVSEIAHMTNPTFQRLGADHWRITFETPYAEGVGKAGVTLNIRRTSGGRIAKPVVTATYQGQELPIKDWRMLKAGLDKIDGSRVVPPEMPEARPADQAPALVRREYEKIQRKLALVRQAGVNVTQQISIGFDGSYWVVGIDAKLCECDELECLSHYATRMYFRRNGRTWKLDIGRFFAAIGAADFSDPWRHRQATLVDLLLGELSKSKQNAAPPPEMSGTSAPAATSNAVTVRKSTVKRI